MPVSHAAFWFLPSYHLTFLFLIHYAAKQSLLSQYMPGVQILGKDASVRETMAMDSTVLFFAALFRQLLSVILQVIKLIISALKLQQALMGSLFHNLPMGEQNDVIRMLDGG